MDLLSHLNPAQRAAVEYMDGPSLVVAGAGSGKTRVITYKVAHLIGSGRFRPEQILAVTFTNKAADEMKTRIQALLGDQLPRTPLICTFHSFCARFLRREIERLGYPSSYTIYDSDDQKRLIKTIIKDLRINEKEITPEQALSRIGQAKIEGIPPERYEARYTFDGDVNIARIYKTYEHRLKQAGALDFDDLILKTNHILETWPETARRLGNTYRYLLVDEFQDTNPPQYTLVRHLTRHHTNICVVGDEDQSIYGFRGAILANILHFEKDFPGCRIFKLDQNYRSTRSILKAASALVANNTRRREKTLWTENDNGAPVGVFEAFDPGEEAHWVARATKEILLDDFTATVGILYRTNFQSRRLEDALRSQAIRYRVVGGLSFYSRKEIRDMVAYLKLIVNHRDDMSLMRIINMPPRGIGDKTLEILTARAATAGSSLWESMELELADTTLSARARSALAAFRELVQSLTAFAAEGSLGELVHQIYQLSGYQSYLKSQSDPNWESREDNIREFLTFAGEHEKNGGTLTSFMDHMALYSSTDEDEGDQRVVLMTLHGAKGLEFDQVFLVGMEEGLLPHSRSLNSDDDIEEERRLCYVGMTRARKRLTLTHARTRPRYNDRVPEQSQPSRFLEEIPAECLQPLAGHGRFTAPSPAESRPRRAKLREQGIVTLDTVEDVRSFFNRSQAPSATPGDKSAAPGPRIVSDPRKFQPKAPPAGGDRRPPAPSHSPARRPAPATGSRASSGGGARGLKVGDRVNHPSFGRGTILKIEDSPKGRKLKISFETRGLKTLLESFAKLEKTS